MSCLAVLIASFKSAIMKSVFTKSEGEMNEFIARGMRVIIFLRFVNTI